MKNNFRCFETFSDLKEITKKITRFAPLSILKQLRRKKDFRLKRNLKTPFWVGFEFETVGKTRFWAGFCFTGHALELVFDILVDKLLKHHVL